MYFALLKVTRHLEEQGETESTNLTELEQFAPVPAREQKKGKKAY